MNGATWMRTWVPGAVLASLLAVGPLAPARAAAGAAAAQSVVQQTTDRILESLRADREAIAADRERLGKLVEDVVLPHFDFSLMSRRVLGKAWRGADAGQRERFVTQFRHLLVRTYARALLEYSDETVSFLEPKEREAGRVTVRMRVGPLGSPVIPIDYRMYERDGKWRVYDVTIDGVSIVINYRSSFAAEIRKDGIDGLIERLSRHNVSEGG